MPRPAKPPATRPSRERLPAMVNDLLDLKDAQIARLEADVVRLNGQIAKLETIIRARCPQDCETCGYRDECTANVYKKA